MILSRELSNNPMAVGFSQGNECMLVDRFAISLIIGEQKIVQNKCKINLISLVKVKYISLSGLCYSFVVKDKISPSHRSISSTDDNLQMDLGVDEVSPPSHDDAEPIPEPSRASDEVECRIPPVIIKKGGRTVVYSYDEYLERQFTKDSSDDENFQFEVPKDLLESFLD